MCRFFYEFIISGVNSLETVTDEFSRFQMYNINAVLNAYLPYENYFAIIFNYSKNNNHTLPQSIIKTNIIKVCI